MFEVYRPTGIFHCSTTSLQVGHSFLPIEGQGHSHGNSPVAMEILHHCLEPLESLMKCVEMNWMAILVGLFFYVIYKIHMCCDARKSVCGVPKQVQHNL